MRTKTLIILLVGLITSTLIFTSCGKDEPVVEEVGDVGFLLVDFGGAESSSSKLSTILPDHWDGDRDIVTFSMNSTLAETATHENLGNQFTVNTGAANPDENAPSAYQGKTLKVVKQPCGWGTEGWGQIIIDFGVDIDKEIVEALPQVNATSDGLLAGTKVLKMDVYYDDTQDANLSFSDLTAKTNVWNADPSRGLLINLILIKHEQNREKRGTGMYISYKGYITAPNQWQTITYDAFDLARARFYFAAGDEVDGVNILPAADYGDGQSDNVYYFRNLRIVDVE